MAYKFKPGLGMLERGHDTYGSKENSHECPICYGGGRHGALKCHNCKGSGRILKNANVKITVKHVPGERFPYKAYDQDGELLYEGQEEHFTKTRAEQESQADWYLQKKKK